MVPYSLLLLFAADRYGLTGVALAVLVRRAIEAIAFVARSGFGNARFWTSQIPAVIGIGLSLMVASLIDELLLKVVWGIALAMLTLTGAAVCAPLQVRRLVMSRLQSRLAKE